MKIKKKSIMIVSIVFLALIFFISNTVKLDDKYYFRFCTEVSIKKCTDKEARILETMPFIRKLAINVCLSENIDFIENKKGLSELSILNFSGDWSPLKKCTALRSFTTTNSSFDDLTYFEYMTELEKLNLALLSEDVSVAGKKGIEKLDSLKYLHLNGLKDNNVNEINLLSSLEQLELSSCDITSLEISSDRLRSLKLSHDTLLTECTFKKSCSALESLTIYDCPQIAVDINELSELNCLKEINIPQGMFSDNEIEFLRNDNIEVNVYN